MIVKFWSPADNGWIVGKLNSDTMEIRLPSGYYLPVMDNGYVSYRGYTCQVLNAATGKPVV